MLARFIITSLVLLAIDAYVFKGVWILCRSINPFPRYIIFGLYWLISVVIIVQLINIFTSPEDYRVAYPKAFLWWSGIFFSLLISKVVFILFHFTDDIVHTGKYLVEKVRVSNKGPEFKGQPVSRGTFLTQIGAGASLLFLGLYSYGIARGRYNFRVLKERLAYDNLPQAFDGLKIVQISDLHLGSFIDEFDKIGEVVEEINKLEPDYIMFTGDMVNVHSNEAEPWIEVFNKLKAKEGMFSIFGNHDYCDYGNYSKDDKDLSIGRLKEIHKEMGFRLLEDEFVELEKNGEKISVVGMHNWGKGFHKEGDIDRALDGIDDSQFKILLSHDPTLWEEKVMDQKSVDLTLSGHTHGMQMGLELPSLGIKISPARLRYKRWAGLYESKSRQQKIYINRGFGVLGFPGRVGMPPEITLLELNKA